MEQQKTQKPKVKLPKDVVEQLEALRAGETKYASLHDALVAVARDLSRVGLKKAQENVTQKYHFRGIDDALNIVGPIMAAHGVIMRPTYKVLDKETYKTTNSQGRESLSTRVFVEGMFTFCYGSEMMDVVTIGEGGDTSDKAVNKAMAMALKYALIMTFLIPVSGLEDGDDDSSQPGGAFGAAATDARAQYARATTTTVARPVGTAGQPRWTAEERAEIEFKITSCKTVVDLQQTASGICNHLISLGDEAAAAVVRAMSNEYRQKKGWEWVSR